MIDFPFIFCLLVFNCLWCVGIFEACQYEVVEEKFHSEKTGWKINYDFRDRMLLWWFSFNTRGWPWWVKKPLYGCLTCMASIHGALFLLVFAPFSGYTLLVAPFYVGALAGLNQLVANKFEL